MRMLLVLLPVLPILAGCDAYAERATEREIYKLAFRTSQFQEALERCEAPDEVLEKHASTWQKNFDAAAKWLALEPAVLADRQKAGREALDADAELGCQVVLKATKISFAAAERWAARIEEEEYCGVMNCD